MTDSQGSSKASVYLWPKSGCIRNANESNSHNILLFGFDHLVDLFVVLVY